MKETLQYHGTAYFLAKRSSVCVEKLVCSGWVESASEGPLEGVKRFSYSTGVGEAGSA